MLNALLLVLPALAGVNAAGGDHYVQFRQKGELNPVKRSPEPAGGDHYVQFRQKGEHIAVRQNVEEGKRYFYPGDVIGFDERGLPITATTTIVVPMTTTQTIWVDPTGAPSSDPTGAPLPSITGNDTALPSASSEANATSVLPTSSPSGNETLPSPTGGNSTSLLPTALPSGNGTQPSPTANATSLLPSALPSGNETEPSPNDNASSALPSALPSGNVTEPSFSANATSVLPTPLPSGNGTEPSVSANVTSALPTSLPSGNGTEPSASSNVTSALPTASPSGNETVPSTSADISSALPTVLPSGNATEPLPSASANATSALPSALPSGNETEPSSSNAPSGTAPSVIISASASAGSVIPGEPSASASASATASASVSESASATSVSASASATESASASASNEASASSAAASETPSASSLSPSVDSDAASSTSESPSASPTPSASTSASSSEASSVWVSVSSRDSDDWISPTDTDEDPEPTSTSPWWQPDTTSTTVWWTPGPGDGAWTPSGTATASATETPSQAPSQVPSSAATSATESSAAVPKPTGATGDRILSGYWADWTANKLPPESIDWSKFDVVNYAFAEPDASGVLQFSQANGPDLLTRLANSAHSAGKRVVLSVGGWTGSAHFSTIMSTASGRSNFVDACVAAYKKYNLDGIDLDWEYPGAPGAAGNAVSASDSDNYLIFLKELRKALPSPALITAATQVWPFYGSNGQPMSDVSAFAEIYDWILIMNYDIYGSSTEPGPNGPLKDGCKTSSQPTANAYAAVAAWTGAGMPAHKISLGLAAYGYIQISDADHLQRRTYPYPVSKRAVTIKNDEGGTSSGQITFASIVNQGALVKDGNGFTGAGGFTRNWDECSSTPWLKSEASGQIITYDDTESFSLKGQFAAQAGLKGCSVWAMDGDLEGFPLISAARSGMGI